MQKKHRIFRGLDCARREECVPAWAEQALAALAAPPAALDGKTLRGSAEPGSRACHLVSALSHRLGLVVAQLGVADKSHELGHLEPLHDALVLSGRVVTADALHTQREVVQAVISRGGDYLRPVKENQPVLRSDIALVFAHDQQLADTITTAQTTDSHGGRVETRRLRASTALESYLRYLLDFFGEDRLDLVLTGYNAGEGAVLRYNRNVPPYAETRNYVRNIIGRYNSLLSSTRVGDATF